MAALGLPFPGVSATLITTVELGGGLALLAGLFTRSAAFLIAAAMAVATLTAHLPMASSCPLSRIHVDADAREPCDPATGPGAHSVDSRLFGRTPTRRPPTASP
jgi:putative oxidoreductase